MLPHTAAVRKTIRRYSLDSMRVVSPAMVRREKCRRPATLTVDVMGNQVGVNGSPFTVCFLCSHKDKGQVIQEEPNHQNKTLPL